MQKNIYQKLGLVATVFLQILFGEKVFRNKIGLGGRREKFGG